MATEAAKKIAEELFKQLPKVAQKCGGLPQAMLPSLSPATGHWRPPLLGARAVAKLRKDVLLSGREWPWEQERTTSPYKTRMKGHKRERESLKKQEKIAANMAKMDSIIADFRANLKVKAKNEQESMMEKILMNPTEIRKKRRKAT
eukprot:CAMPEP_0196572684 /NCGR_PEP_ID=MMETSP1081-20130531/2682_1 /TAXON_ID=36882 /ORGANISM="Pyramimonas amylifera, Strain CCMP720" /LENGTH=145 /DNA_ID=CAMNT_0041890077 /DNA_START=60 /DNA_END=497 /DNA_ORIENTATION=-